MKLIILFTLIPMITLSQNLDDLRWKKRVILIKTASFEDPKAQEQYKIMKEHQDELLAYKLVVVHYTNEGVRRGNKRVPVLKTLEKITTFKVSLIGLDGGIKFESKEPETAKTFFDLINSMLMRRKELRKGT